VGASSLSRGCLPLLQNHLQPAPDYPASPTCGASQEGLGHGQGWAENGAAGDLLLATNLFLPVGSPAVSSYRAASTLMLGAIYPHSGNGDAAALPMADACAHRIAAPVGTIPHTPASYLIASR